MTSPGALMAVGMPSAQAVMVGRDTATGLTATGSTKAGALVLAADISVFTTVASSTGAVLPFAEGQPEQVIYNGGAQPLSVYAQAGEVINALSTGAVFSVTNGKSAIFSPGKQRWIANLSA